MSERRNTIYINGDILHSLWLIAKSRPPDADNRYATAEDVAEEMIRATIKEKFPQLAEHRKQVDKLERELLKTLK
jgi:hypothetical protein